MFLCVNLTGGKNKSSSCESSCTMEKYMFPMTLSYRSMNTLYPISAYLLQKCIGAETFNMYTVSNRFINTRSEAVNITVGAVDFYVPADYGISPHNNVERKE